MTKKKSTKKEVETADQNPAEDIQSRIEAVQNTLDRDDIPLRKRKNLTVKLKMLQHELKNGTPEPEGAEGGDDTGSEGQE
jgi:hypothetical protein